MLKDKKSDTWKKGWRVGLFPWQYTTEKERQREVNTIISTKPGSGRA